MATKKAPARRHRDAATGRFVSESFAKLNPATTISETIKKIKKFWNKLVNKKV